MTNRVPLSITNLNFDGIKQSLIDFLKTQNSPIKDYNYEGSAFNILLDVLAVNGHYQSMYSNMVANEMFLDSALLRSSVVSKAKELGYTPRSAKASTAKIKLSVGPEVPGNTTLVVPAQTRFQSTVGDQTFSYYNLNEVTLNWNGSVYEGEFYIYAGTVFQQNTTFDQNKKLYLEADNIDTSTLTVRVVESAFSATEYIYTNNVKLINTTSNSRVFFLYETDLKRYEVKFGDGIFGRALSNGNVVKMRFLSVDIDAPYGATDFLPDTSLFDGMTKSIETVIPSTGSFAIEDIDSIRRNAQMYNQSQNRSVIAGDYESNIRTDFPDVIDVTVWGGEENDPPIYGKVFLSLVMQDLSHVPQSRALEIESKIKEKATMNIRPEIVDPEYFNVVVSGFVRYQSAQIGLTASELKDLVMSKVSEYSQNYLEGFRKSLAFSQLSNSISKIDDAITSVVFEFKVSTQLDIESTRDTNVLKNFRNALVSGSIKSNSYVKTGDLSFTYFLKDVNGKLEEWKFEGSDETLATFSKEIGTVNYSTGLVNGSGLRGTPVSGGNALTLNAEIDSVEIVPGFNQVLIIDVAQSTGKIEVKGS